MDVKGKAHGRPLPDSWNSRRDGAWRLVYQPDVLAQDHVEEPLIEQPSEVTQVQEEPGHIHNLITTVRGYVDPENAEIVSVHQLACLIDHLDKSLYCRGQVVVKGPDIWGQNRLTQYRAEYEDQMRTQLTNFEIILSSYQRRADLAALTSATSIGASLAPQVSNSRNVSTTTNVTPAIPSAAGLVGPSDLVANANTLIGTMTPLLSPSNLTALALANKGAAQGLGIEPNVLLDERSDFLYHLQQLRRNNVGDDKADMPGYSLYLVRMPVSILPGDKSIKGKGAMVTVQAKHNLTGDVLANTFRNVVILDTAYQLMDAVTRGQYLLLEDKNYDHCENEVKWKLQLQCPPKPSPPKTGVHEAMADEAGGSQPRSYGETPGPTGGNTQGAKGSAPTSEVIPIYGTNNLYRLVCAVKEDQEAWYRHDPSVVSWLLNELASAHDFMREQARLGNPAFQPEVFENIGNHVLTRSYKALSVHRENWLQASAATRHDQVRPIDVSSAV